MKITKDLSTLLLALFLILYGLMAFGVTFPYSDFILGALALVAGFLKLIGR